MAGVAHIRRIDMVGPFAAGCDPVVTTQTVVKKRRVIDHGGQPRGHQVASIAFLGGNNMINGFTTGYHVIMTGGAHTDNFVVIHRTVG